MLGELDNFVERQGRTRPEANLNGVLPVSQSIPVHLDIRDKQLFVFDILCQVAES